MHRHGQADVWTILLHWITQELNHPRTRITIRAIRIVLQTIRITKDLTTITRITSVRATTILLVRQTIRIMSAHQTILLLVTTRIQLLAGQDLTLRQVEEAEAVAVVVQVEAVPVVHVHQVDDKQY